MDLETDSKKNVDLILAHKWPSKVTHVAEAQSVDKCYRHLKIPLEFYRLYTCTNGRCKVRVSTKSGSKFIDLKAGEAIVVYPGSWAYSEPDSHATPFSIFGIQLTPSKLTFIDNNKQVWPNRHFNFDYPLNPDCMSIQQAFKIFDNSILLTDQDLSLSIIKLIYKSTNELLRTKLDVGKLSVPEQKHYHLQQLIYDLDHNFHRPVTRAKLAKKHQLLDSVVAKFFKVSLETTFRKYLSTLRMQYATELLIGTSFKINIVSQLLGYKQDDSFSSAFLKFFGMTPTTFRDSAKSKDMYNKLGHLGKKGHIIELLSLKELEKEILPPLIKARVTLYISNLSPENIELYETSEDHGHILCAKVSAGDSAYIKLSNTSVIIVKNVDGHILGGYNPLLSGSIALYK